MFRKASRLAYLLRRLLRLGDDLDRVRVSLGRLHQQYLLQVDDFDDPRKAEFTAFSQFGEDGILQYLLSRTADVPTRFVEFGIEDYREATTRLLAELGGWSGLVMDGASKNIKALHRDPIMWRCRLTARTAFVTSENIDALLYEAGYNKDVGVLVVDIDGNDFWIWRSISVCRPAIVVIEYNALWGLEKAVSVPYEPMFERFGKHHSGLYAGASLPALTSLAHEKGYRLVAVNSQANNAFFVSEDSGCRLPTIEIEDWMGEPGFQQARGTRGRLTFAGDRESLADIADLPLIDFGSGGVLRVADLLDTGIELGE